MCLFWTGLKQSQVNLSEIAKSVDKDGIKKFLHHIKLSQYIELFLNNDIDGNMLVALSQEDLKDLGVNNKFHRTKIIVQFQSYLEKIMWYLQ